MACIDNIQTITYNKIKTIQYKDNACSHMLKVLDLSFLTVMSILRLKFL